MSERLATFERDVELAGKLWHARVIVPYSDAYDAAFLGFKGTLDDQTEADKRNAELSVLAASVLSGSLMVAAVGSVAIRRIARRAALQAIGRRNLSLAMSAARSAGANPAIKFAVEKFADEANSAVRKAAQERIVDLEKNVPTRLTSSPLSLKSQMEATLYEQQVCIRDIAKMVDDTPSLSAAEKNGQFALLRRAAVANRPVGSLNKEALARELELSMYMSYVLDLDTLIDVPMRAMSQGQYSGLAEVFRPSERANPIDRMPSDPRYPRPGMPRPSGLVMPAHQRVGIEEAGSRIVDKTNRLHGSIIGGRFFERTGLFSRNMSRLELHKAESVLNELGLRSRRKLQSDLPQAIWA